METKTAQEILDEMQDCDDGCVITDGTHYDSKWVNFDELISAIDKLWIKHPATESHKGHNGALLELKKEVKGNSSQH